MIGEEADSIMLPTAGCVNGRLSNSRDAGCPQNAKWMDYMGCEGSRYVASRSQPKSFAVRSVNRAT
jgi:hypothetical protein